MGQMEFDFMKDNYSFQIGESVVNRENLKGGRVIDSTLDDTGSEAVKIEYADGMVEWVFVDKVSKLLLETDPKPNTNNLNEDWSV